MTCDHLVLVVVVAKLLAGLALVYFLTGQPTLKEIIAVDDKPSLTAREPQGHP